MTTNTIRNGASTVINLQPTETLKVVAVTGTYTLTGTAGSVARTTIANAATGGTYGPYAAAVTLLLVSSAQSEIDFDSGTAPVIESDTVARVVYDGAGRGVGIADSVAGTNALFQPSSKYRFFIPGQQFVTSGSAKDKSGNGADAAINGSYTDAAAWANNGYITTGAGANLSLAVANAKSQFDLATESVIFSAVVNKAAPAATEVIFGNADTGTVQGFYLTARANGTVRIALTTSTGAQLIATDSAAVLFDGTDHVLTVAIDGPSKAVYFYRDGALLNTFTNGFTGGTPSAGSGAGFVIGASQPGVSIALKTNGLHLLKFTGGLPVNLGMLAQKLAGAPRVHLTDADIQT